MMKENSYKADFDSNLILILQSEVFNVKIILHL